MKNIEIYLYSHHGIIKNLSSDQLTSLKEVLSFEIPNSIKIRQYKLADIRKKMRTAGFEDQRKLQNDLDYWSTWEGKAVFIDDNNSFPLGFAKRIRWFAYSYDPFFKIYDKRTKPVRLDKNIKFIGQLRDYQNLILDKNLNETMGIFNLATGAGKTILAIALISRKNVSTVIIVPTLALINQWIEKLKEFSNCNIGFTSSKQVKEGDVFIITQASLNKVFSHKTDNPKTQQRYDIIKKIYSKAGMLLIDECHRSAAKTWKRIFAYSNAYFIFGFTATTDKRSDHSDFEYYALLGDKLSVLPYDVLRDMGYSVPIHVYFYNIPFRFYDRSWKWYNKDDKSIEDDYIVENSDRNNKIVDVIIDRGLRRSKQTLVVFNRVLHGEIIYNRTRSQMDRRKDLAMLYDDKSLFLTKVALVRGKTKNKDREQIYEKFKRGKINVLVAQNQLIGEGWDVPNIEVIVMCAGGKSEITRIQNAGRGSRLNKGKKYFEIHDFADQGRYVQDHAADRAKTYDELGCEFKNIQETSLSHLF